MQNEFPNAKNVCYLNTASEGLLPQSAFKAMQEMAVRKQNPQRLGDEEYFALPRRCRALLAGLLNCTDDEIGLVGSTSFGITALALSLPLRDGDEVLLVERDFPSNNFSWEALRERGIRIRSIPFVLDCDQTSRVVEAISDSTRVLSVSPVHFYTGFRYDLDALSEACRRRDVLLIADAIHMVGTEPINLQKTPVDALCAAAHKWQLGPSGTGFIYIKRDLMSKLKPAFTGWMHNKDAASFDETSMFEYRPSSFSRRFELGTAPIVLLAAYEQSLKLISECKLEYIEQHNRRLVSMIVDFFQEIGWPVPRIPRSSIVGLIPPERYSSWKILDGLCDQEIYTAVREGYLRIAPHFYNTERDITRFAEGLRKIL